MSLTQITTRAQLGISAPEVRVEVHISSGLPVFTVVGLPETAVREARDRVRSAIINSGFEFPARRITVNLAPADLPKEGGRYDLPIALGILAASSQVDISKISANACFGELALSGECRKIEGLLPALIASKRAGRAVTIPRSNQSEAIMVRDLPVQLADSLAQICASLNGGEALPQTVFRPEQKLPHYRLDLAEVHGQHQAKRALEIAAAGGHHMLMMGPPGTGKSMLARRLPGLLPALDDCSALESAALAALAGRVVDGLSRCPPFRAPHHTATPVAMVGGGQAIRPGEISLAHRGVLFLDELPEFPRAALEALREPLETGAISIARARRTMHYPARFQLLAAMNPCPCGFAGDPRRECRCSPEQVQRYRSKISGPLLDRLDLQVALNWEPPLTHLDEPATGESSSTVRARVAAARQRQQARPGGVNAAIPRAGVREFCQPEAAGRGLLVEAAERRRLSARACDRVLRVARTIADLAGQDRIARAHIGEALSLHHGNP